MMKTLACTFALLFAFVAPASAVVVHGGGGHGGGGFHGGGYGGGYHGPHGEDYPHFQGDYGGGARFHERGGHGGYEHRHFHGEGGWRDGTYYACTPWQFAAGMCGPDY